MNTGLYETVTCSTGEQESARMDEKGWTDQKYAVENVS